MPARWNPVPLIFLGPTLRRTEAERLCPGEYHGPVARGVLPDLAGPLPRAILILDGRFAQTRAVSPKEILASIDAGHALFGASSMGALRAVELEPFGMTGVGRIFEAFRSGEWEADDEVAVGYDPVTLEPLSEPLVNIRVALSEAVAARVIGARDSAELLARASRAHYWTRTYLALAEAAPMPEEARRRLLQFLREQATDQKAEDARQALRLVAEVAAYPPPGRTVGGPDLPSRPEGPAPGVSLAALPPALKGDAPDSVRTVPATVTQARLDRVRAAVGITRVADVTGLDVLGVPNFIAVRPSRDRMCNSAYSGKSLRADEARVGAQMEALEVACGHDDRVAMEWATHVELTASGVRAVHPDHLIPLPGAPADLTEVALPWVVGWDVESGAPVRVPADAVFFRRGGGAGSMPAAGPGRETGPETGSGHGQGPWKVSSNGLASGNVLAEALAHALAEVIERDAETLFRIALEFARFPALMRAVAGPPRVSPPRAALPAPREFPFVRTSTLPTPLASLADRFRRQGLAVALRNITSDVGVPVLLCVIHERTHDARRHLVHYGCGAHPDPCIAARRALTEAAQSRVTAIQGSREDLQAGAIEPCEPPADWFGTVEAIDLRDLPVARFDDVRGDVRFMLDRLRDAGLRECVAVDLTNPAIGFPVVKVLVPGLELALHALETNRVPLGWRARRYFEADLFSDQVGTPSVLEQASSLSLRP